jgi:polysaccharide biosynthesis protein PslH
LRKIRGNVEMKILQLCNKVPYPPKDGGAIAISNLSEAFADNGHQVTILAMSTKKHPVAIDSIPKPYFSSIKFVFVPVNTRIRPLHLIRNLVFSSLPYNAERFINASFSREIEKILSENEYDIIQLEGLYLVPYIPLIRKFSNAQISLRAHNVEHEIWMRIKSNTKNPLKKYYFGILANRMVQFEHDAINRYDLLVPISSKDYLYFQRHGNLKPALVVSVGIPDAFFNKKNSFIQPSSVFFLGALDWTPNQEGLVWFIDSVWEKLKLLEPSLTFHIAGRNAPKWIERKFTGNNIVYHGEVENAGVFFDEQQIMIVPLFAGSGLRVKIIEAMARSKVVVSTSIGAEGLDVKDREHLLIAENSRNFLEAIQELIHNPDFYNKLGENALTLAKNRYNNESISGELINFYSKSTSC